MVRLEAAALLFDMDGTLVDSNAAVERAWAFWCRRYQLDLEEVLHFSHGRPTLATMDYFGARFAPGKNWNEEADEMQRMEQADLGSTKAIGGARELLARLDDSRWAVVTSAPRQLAEMRIQAAGLPLPKLLVPADEISIGKPHPEGYLKAASELGVAAGECVVFEDTPPGVEAGLNAGMQVIGLLTTVTADRLRTNLVIRDYSNLRVTSNSGGYSLEVSS
jgi:sugar-phosphatase